MKTKAITILQKSRENIFISKDAEKILVCSFEEEVMFMISFKDLKKIYKIANGFKEEVKSGEYNITKDLCLEIDNHYNNFRIYLIFKDIVSAIWNLEELKEIYQNI